MTMDERRANSAQMRLVKAGKLKLFVLPLF